MNEINNLTYSLEINYTNNTGLKTSIIVKFYDNGLEIKTITIDDISITEETINGRVLSGKFENLNEYCGYRYDYKNGGNLINLNPQIPIDKATSLINKKEIDCNFLSAKLVLSSILRNDYKVVTLNKGNLNITKTISVENEKSEIYNLQEITDLIKKNGEEFFIEKFKKRIYKINNKQVVEEIKNNNNIKSNFNKLSIILNQNPKSHKELIKIKNNILKNNSNIINNEGKYYE